MKPIRYFIDVSSLLSEKYTGIQIVNYEIVKYFYEKFWNNSVFFCGDTILHNSTVQFILQTRSGREAITFVEHGHLYNGSIKYRLNTNEEINVGIFPCVKNIFNVFDYEAQIIYDLTFLLTPEFHNQENIELHRSRIEKSLSTNDLNVCISESTREDIETYLQIARKKTVVAYPGYDIDWKKYESMYSRILNSNRVEKFILILGTIEPRKNIQLVLSFLENNPEVLNQYHFVFVGQDGWGNTFNMQVEQIHLPGALKEKKIKHLSYVSEEEKNILLMTAQFLVYPSIYEGFGLPVLEAMHFGCPVLASMSSSIPEIGEDVIEYFDPYSLDSFANGFESLEQRLKFENEKIRNLCRRKAEIFTWDRFVNTITKHIVMDLDEKHR
ncbi:glycosyltransferase family 1 protein [Candidatus Parcubacteria bacterium]|nr:MAG: glycosyltransferase family 1 protein [Candidatus Parcubacteria bacterium]